ncbi:FxsA family protein [Pseudomaricurvus sp.]|uniref:FxsA family protein n=1 Tax=Pseudomaricurvus sp. TaxID=2004510 RepID=UPI003F6CA74E
MPFLLLFIVVPVVEMWVLIQVGAEIGALPTIALVLLTAMIGLALLRKQGASALLRANQRMESGQLPAEEMVEGIFLAVGGALLLTPGFVTDALGFACLIPGLRQWLIGKALKKVIFRATSSAGFTSHSAFGEQAQGGKKDSSGDVIEGEFRRQDAPDKNRDRLR